VANGVLVTVHEHLIAIGAGAHETDEAEMLLGRFFPLGRPIVLTDEVIAAARAGDAALLATLLADEDTADDVEREALRELDQGPAEDRERVSLD